MDTTMMDALSGEEFTREALFEFESKRPLVNAFLLVTGGLAFSGLVGLLYNGLGQIAMLTTANAKPGVDDFQGLLILGIGFVLGVAGFFVANSRRTEELRKLDSVLSFASLECELADGTQVTRRLRELRRKQRVLVIFGDTATLPAAVQAASAYRRRWLTSSTLVVAVGDPRDGSALKEGGLWLARPVSPEAWWRCRSRLEAAGGLSGEVTPGFASWVLLGRTGRVMGEGVAKEYDEVLAFIGVDQDLSLLPERSQSSGGQGYEDAHKEVLAVHDAFYKALMDGDAQAMRPLWMDIKVPDAPDMPRVPWGSVLSEKAAVLSVVDVDVVFPQTSEAIVTSIEVCPGNPGLFNEGGPGGKGTLLATKRFRREESSDGEAGPWRLISHQTIPYCSNTLATQCLRCTYQGCALLKPTG